MQSQVVALIKYPPHQSRSIPAQEIVMLRSKHEKERRSHTQPFFNKRHLCSFLQVEINIMPHQHEPLFRCQGAFCLKKRFKFVAVPTQFLQEIRVRGMREMRECRFYRHRSELIGGQPTPCKQAPPDSEPAS